MAKRSLPPTGYRFGVNFYSGGTSNLFATRDGPDAYFQSISGISVEFETETVNDGANARYVQKLPKKPIFPNLTLKRGVLLNSDILDWVNGMLTNSKVEFEPLDVEVNLMNEEGESLLNIRFIQAWPCKWSISDFNAMESSIVMETLELSYQYFKLIK